MKADTANTVRIVGGMRGTASGWDYDTSVLYSEVRVKDELLSGFPLYSQIMPLLDSGVINPFGPTTDPNALAETLTHVKDPNEPFRFSGIDQSGNTVNQDSPEFKGKPLIIDIMGTWCPNCHDEAPVLEKLYRKYHDQGLEVVGLSYEYVDDAPRNLKQIAIYREKFGIPFVVCVREHTKDSILANADARLANSPDREIETALGEIAKIARLRLEDTL